MKILQDKWKEDEVEHQHFYLISFQSYFEFPNEEGYQPCEVACIEYSLFGGIIREWHALINPGPIVRGMAAESKIWSEKTHKIPVWGFEIARTDHYDIWMELVEFINPGLKSKELPPLFCMISELRKNEFCLNELSRLANVTNRLRVFQWEGLVLALYGNAGVQPPSMNMIVMGATSTMYDYEANTKCEYHHEMECVYCSLLTIKKCAFWMSDALSSIYKFEITEHHLPVKQSVEYTIINPEDLRITEHKHSFTRDRFDPEALATSTREKRNYETHDHEKQFIARDIRYRPRFQICEKNPLTTRRGEIVKPYTEEMLENDFKEGKFMHANSFSSRMSDTDSTLTLKSAEDPGDSEDSRNSSTNFLIAESKATKIQEKNMMRGEKKRANRYLEESFPATEDLKMLSLTTEDRSMDGGSSFMPSRGRGQRMFLGKGRDMDQWSDIFQ